MPALVADKAVPTTPSRLKNPSHDTSSEKAPNTQAADSHHRATCPALHCYHGARGGQSSRDRPPRGGHVDPGGGGPVPRRRGAPGLSERAGGPDGELQSWDPELVDLCSWSHIICDANNRVTHIELGYLNLSGPLSPELAKLDQLQYMRVGDNNIQGTIPEEFSDLGNLISLDVYNNNISGPIPASLGKLSALKFMRLYQNRLTGPIPMELTGLSHLEILDLWNNDLCGTIPTSGPFQNLPPSSFAGNPRLRIPGRQQGSDC
ncbi:leucine-rich repeat protein 1-like [Lolium rigidum]|uniref:leucine-rich repeat protein 1-like n=1 Tax=Lolium rigidum TaxID=89674 RepID=UPI001F5DC770|nr:leucine-rich repeat protein 1-like [Lolium rigidum]